MLLVVRLIFVFLLLFVIVIVFFFFFQAEDGIRDGTVTGVQTCALPISSETRRELVHRALRDADERRRQVPAREAPERRAIARAPVKLPARPVTIAGAVRIEGAMRGDEDVRDHDGLAARPPHSGGEPRIDDP